MKLVKTGAHSPANCNELYYFPLLQASKVPAIDEPKITVYWCCSPYCRKVRGYHVFLRSVTFCAHGRKGSYNGYQTSAR
ncbi:hypothetical protein MPH_07223 [Macrophomina phaseolina MS6]|uniref:Uncharacterized protein n=1 Tax=Macrophomina phaseolina (strain MS6) TaxID=1126212 RepID=K2RS79_MACPH|nr:hypothetical protein MPH_07223 [Macrophomina phaseolina MS6]